MRRLSAPGAAGFRTADLTASKGCSEHLHWSTLIRLRTRCWVLNLTAGLSLPVGRTSAWQGTIGNAAILSANNWAEVARMHETSSPVIDMPTLQSCDILKTRLPNWCELSPLLDLGDATRASSTLLHRVTPQHHGETESQTGYKWNRSCSWVVFSPGSYKMYFSTWVRTETLPAYNSIAPVTESLRIKCLAHCIQIAFGQRPGLARIGTFFPAARAPRKPSLLAILLFPLFQHPSALFIKADAACLIPGCHFGRWSEGVFVALNLSIGLWRECVPQCVVFSSPADIR